MSEIERLHQARIAREASARGQQPGEKPKEYRDPTEWRPRGDRDYERVQSNVDAVLMTSQPLRHQSLAQFDPEAIAAMEAGARGALIRTMEGQGYAIGERGVRIQWMLTAEGYGFKMPDGYVHPEADDDLKREGMAAWKRVVEMASDSVMKYLYVQVWRRRRTLGGTVEMKVLGNPEPREFDYTTSDDDVVEGEIVEEPCTDFDAGDPDEPDGDPADTCRQCGVLFGDHP